jgi:two-component system, NtrC family, response regulator AtoC
MTSEATVRVKQVERLNPVPPDDVLFGRSRAMNELRLRAAKICRTNISVLLHGEGGTGKEALARWIHNNSTYGGGEFVKVNCAAIPGSLLESELFGYEKGAFTGANHAKPGRAELAHNGTLFLDEISELGMNLQSKLLHFLQDGCYSRLGDQFQRSVDTRLVCATNRDLEQLMQAGQFRADLFYRINVFRMQLPPLRERRDDIPVLAEFFRQHHQKQFAKQAEPFAAEMLDYLRNLDWPGNVRELSNGVARYVLIGPEAVIAQPSMEKRRGTSVGSDLRNEAGTTPLKRVAKDAIREMERNLILESLRAHQWNRRKTAVALKISYRALIYKIRDAGLVSRRAAPGPGANRPEVQDPVVSAD